MSTVTIGGTEYELRPLSADAALRIMDIVAEATDELQQVIDTAQQWRSDYIERNSFTVTSDAYDDPDMADRLKAAGIDKKRVDEAGVLRMIAEPEEVEMFAAVFPEAWRSLRDPILDACVIVLAPTPEMLDHEDAGTLDEYMAGWRRKIRGEATPEELVDLLWAMFQHTKEQLLGTGGAVGKLLARVGDLFSSPKKPPAKKPTTKRASSQSTRSRQRTAGRGEKSSPSAGTTSADTSD